MNDRVADPPGVKASAVQVRAPGFSVIEILKIREVGLLVILLLTSVALTLLAPRSFPTPQNIFNVLRFVSYIALSAFGECMVIITGGIDLSVGSVMGLSGISGALVMAAGLSTPWGILASLAMGTFWGLTNGLLVSKVKMQPFIVTLGTMSIARGLCYGLTGGWPVPSRGRAAVEDLPDSFVFLGQGMLHVPFLSDIWPTFKIPYPLIFMLIMGLITAFFLSRTVRGRHIYATGGNPEAARLVGIATDNIKLLVYTLCGLLSGIGGMLMTARLGTGDPRGGETYELDVIAAVVVGGTSLQGGEGSIPGALLAAIFMQLIRNGMTLLRIDPYWQPLAIGSVIILGVMIDQFTRSRRAE
ncbi:MAG: ABC transporter permease [Anaerolineae bacterium]